MTATVRPSSELDQALNLGSIRAQSRAGLVSELTQRIRRGKLRAGGILPPERELAEQLSLSRTTVRKALADLEQAGLIECRHGSGRRVLQQGTDRLGLASRTIAVLSETSEINLGMQQYTGIEGHVQAAATAALHQGRWHALTLHAGELLERGVDALTETRPAGVIITSHAVQSQGNEIIPALRDAMIPHVVSTDIDIAQECDRVVHDHAQGAADLTRLLIARGRKRIVPLFIADGLRYWAYCRLDGYRRAMEEAGLEPLPPVIVPVQDRGLVEEDREHPVRMVVGFAHEHLAGAHAAEAIVAGTDVQALHVAEAAERLGRNSVDDLLITGYDHSLRPELQSPAMPDWKPFATIDKDNPRIGEQMVAVLERRIDDSRDAQQLDGPIVEVVPHRLVEQRS